MSRLRPNWPIMQKLHGNDYLTKAFELQTDEGVPRLISDDWERLAKHFKSSWLRKPANFENLRHPCFPSKFWTIFRLSQRSWAPFPKKYSVFPSDFTSALCQPVESSLWFVWRPFGPVAFQTFSFASSPLIVPSKTRPVFLQPQRATASSFFGFPDFSRVPWAIEKGHQCPRWANLLRNNNRFTHKQQ